MKTNQKVVHGFHVGLASQLLAMLRAMLAIRACHMGLRMVAEVAWATFRLGGQIEFGIIYIHTQLNTTVYVGITTKNHKKLAKNNLPKPAAHAPSCSLPQHHRSNSTILTTKINHR